MCIKEVYGMKGRFRMTESDKIKERIKMNVCNDLKATGKFDEATLEKFKKVWDEVTSKYVFTEKAR